jgi:hypothetical protein
MPKAEPFTSRKVHADNFTYDIDTKKQYGFVENYALLLDLQAGVETLKEYAYCKKCEKHPDTRCFEKHPIWVTFSWIDFQKSLSGIEKR